LDFLQANLLFVSLSLFVTFSISVMSGFNSLATHSSREVTMSSLSLFGLKKDMPVTGVRVSLFIEDILMFDNIGLPEMKPVLVP
jgi:hypothetical protein